MGFIHQPSPAAPLRDTALPMGLRLIVTAAFAILVLAPPTGATIFWQEVGRKIAADRRRLVEDLTSGEQGLLWSPLVRAQGDGVFAVPQEPVRMLLVPLLSRAQLKLSAPTALPGNS